MIKLDKTEIVGWEAAIRGMRNPMNSWDLSDSEFVNVFEDIVDAKTMYLHSANIGRKDVELMNKLAAGGPVHAKYRRMIVVYVDILAPLYWWKEFDTYKVGTVANSCSTMHKIADKKFTLNDFSNEHLLENDMDIDWGDEIPFSLLMSIVNALNTYRHMYNETKDKKWWWQIIQLLPSSYNQKRTVMLNYEVLANIYKHRKDHKLDEWIDFCKWIEGLPFSSIITGGNTDER